MSIHIGWSYHNYLSSMKLESNSLDVSSFDNITQEMLDTVDNNSMPDWCKDSAYVDSVVIPLQWNYYNLNTNYKTQDSFSKFIICQDSHACDLHDTLYKKSVSANELKTQLLKINSKLDSIEKKQ